jgi:putative CocE/NonD family hydrolase
LFRTPYDKNRCDSGRYTYLPVGREVARKGYVVVLQDTRGRFASDGEFYPFFSYDRVMDSKDGFDTVEWVALLPYCSGKVGTFGDSYGAWTQWELARLRPPHLAAMMPSGMPATALDYPILRVARRVLWVIGRMAPETRRRAGGAGGPFTAEEAYDSWENIDRGKWYWFMPWRELPEDALAGMARSFFELLERMPVDYVAQQRQHDQISVPIFHLTGWFDISVGGSIQHYTGMIKDGMTGHARSNQKLVVGPWTHMDPYYDLPRKLGLLDFGPEAQAQYTRLLVRWFDYWLKGIQNGVYDEPPIRLFIMGDNLWRFENEWPLARTVYTDYYLRSGGTANTPYGDGVLCTICPDEEPADTFEYDPRDPVMSIFNKNAYYEPLDQKPLDHRRDVLVFSSEPLDSDIEATGPVSVKLWAASTAVDTDFTAKLVDVYPDGTAIGICSGIIRAQYRHGTAEPELIKPGKPYRYEISLEPTAYVFRVGHRIRLDISSSNFPEYDRNHNTGLNYYRDAQLQTAQQTIFHDSARPSKLILPVIPR